MESLGAMDELLPRFIALGIPGVFLVLLALWGTIAVILDFHWRRYGPNHQAIARFRICFYGIGLACAATAAVAQIMYFS